MATAAENLQTAYNNYARLLAEVSASPKPSYTENGRAMNWTEYQQFIISQMGLLRVQIVEATGPFEVRTQGRG